MSLISKLCVTFLIWTITGIVLDFGVMLHYEMKVRKLFPHDDETLCKYKIDSWKKCYSLLGMDYGKKELFSEETGSKANILEDIAYGSFVGMIWPITVTLLSRGFGDTYLRYKDEYDRGIRVRKEPS